MQTIKTLVVVALLLTVCYGAYVAMNAPDVEVPEDLKEWAEKTGNDVLPEFSIPPITNNDAFSSGAADLSQPAMPQIDLSQGSSAFPGSQNSDQLSVPAFPGVPTSQPSIGASTGIAPPSIDLPSLNPSPLNTGAMPFAANDPSKGSAAGPAIPFTPSSPGDLPSFPGANLPGANASGATLGSNGLPSADNSAVDSLIGAVPPSFGAPSIGAGAGATGLPDLNGEQQSLLIGTSIPKNNPEIMDSASGDAKANQPTKPFAVAKTEGLQLANDGKLREALELLSPYYESPDLGYDAHKDLVDLLDALTREVVYSDRPLILPAYTVSAQDTLQSVAEKHNINPELLAAINKMGNTTALVPNTKIKVLDGPFNAQVSLSRGELTVFLRKMYAGRFPVSISQKNRPPQARYEVVDRRTDRSYYAANTSIIPAGNPTNPYGGFWISLGSEYAIHGSPEQVPTDLIDAGCISLAPIDAADVYRILSKSSAVDIRP